MDALMAGAATHPELRWCPRCRRSVALADFDADEGGKYDRCRPCVAAPPKKRRAPKTCHRCGELGHIAKTCPDGLGGRRLAPRCPGCGALPWQDEPHACPDQADSYQRRAPADVYAVADLRRAFG